ncbi:MAG: protein translocase subunit SecF [Trueperella sp.]|nr:protein translocase subunit SecF [Trueperella sp.]
MLSMYSIGNRLYSGEKSLPIIGRRKIWFAIAIVLVLISALAFAFTKPNLGIEFRGGSQFTVSGTANTSHQPAYDAVAEVGKDSAPRVSSVGSETIRVQTVQLDDQQTQQLKEKLAAAYEVPEQDVTSTFIGPSWGQDILSKAIRALVVFVVLISIVLTLYFRSWTIALGAFGALLHDFIVTLGIYWILGFEITPATVIGLLTIMGYSLYDTVVVFDKVRENTEKLTSQTQYTYEESANLAINQTLIRSLNTSITGLLPVMSVLFLGVGILGADTLRDLALVMFVGMLLSTLSSIFLAAPLAVTLGMRNEGIKEHTKRVLDRRGDTPNILVERKVLAADLSPAERESGAHRGQAAQPKRKHKKQRSKR